MAEHLQDKTAIRDAATVIVLRDKTHDPRILMGQRGAQAAFMPNKFVFPGGAVDAEDKGVLSGDELPHPCGVRLQEACDTTLAPALAAAAIRELWEETGLMLARAARWSDEAPAGWQAFAARGMRPDPGGMQFVFRALTPPGRPRRFDARFFLVDADRVAGDLDDFSEASDELAHLQWVRLQDARQFDMPFITEVVLAEVAKRVTDPAPPAGVPYFRNNDEESLFRRLRGRALP